MNSRLQITFLHMEVSPPVEFRIRREAARLDRCFDRIQSCRAVIGISPAQHSSGYTCHLRIEIGIPGPDLIVQHEASFHPFPWMQNNSGEQKHLETQAGCDAVFAAIREGFAIARHQLEEHSNLLEGKTKVHAPAPPVPTSLAA